MRAELDGILETGVALDNEECFEGVIAVAVPIPFKQNLHTMGLALVAPSARQTTQGLSGFLPAMKDAAANLAKTYPE